MTEHNDALAYQTLDYIREHPEEWNQRNYFCGTTACFAGHAIFLNAENTKGLEAAVKYCSSLVYTANPAGVAMKLLGFTWTEAQYVFGYMGRSFEVLESRVKEVLNGELSQP